MTFQKVKVLEDLAQTYGYTCNFDKNGYEVTAANNEDDAALAEAFGYDDTCFNGTTSEVVENRAAVDASQYGYGRETDSSCDDKDLAAEFGYGSDGPNDFSDGMVTNSSQNSSDDASTDVSSNDDERTECDGSTSSSNGTSCESDFSSDSTGDGSDYSSADGDNSSSDGGQGERRRSYADLLQYFALAKNCRTPLCYHYLYVYVLSYNIYLAWCQRRYFLIKFRK